ncbi:SANT/Myb domain [Dillenia turbinata]|uniref:SANT/Myb domain n=1 Tax=Dillenia turbinata TaxID=194707 RepID=A0AAN8VA71_9MAGN
MSRTCSQGGSNGHNSRTCSESGENGIMLFGVRVIADDQQNSFRKCASMNNLSQLEQPQDSNPDVAAGYASDDVVHPSARTRERKRGVPWTEEEHKLFLLGLQKVGKGDWRGISRNFVKTRTPTQVASHAQKYFLRRSNLNRRRRRSSLFDITPDSFVSSQMEEDSIHKEIQSPTQKSHLNCNNLGAYPIPAFPMTLTPVISPPVTGETSPSSASASAKLIRPIPILPVPPSSKMTDLNLNKSTSSSAVDPPLPLSLKLSTPSSSSSDHSSAFQAMQGGDKVIIVA